jgi:hypothetical protein
MYDIVIICVLLTMMFIISEKSPENMILVNTILLYIWLALGIYIICMIFIDGIFGMMLLLLYSMCMFNLINDIIDM